MSYSLYLYPLTGHLFRLLRHNQVFHLNPPGIRVCDEFAYGHIFKDIDNHRGPQFLGLASQDLSRNGVSNRDRNQTSENTVCLSFESNDSLPKRACLFFDVVGHGDSTDNRNTPGSLFQHFVNI